MGVSSSKDDGLSRDPLKFGEAGEVGALVGVFHDHNLTMPRDRVTDRRDSVAVVSREFLDLYNRTTADRRVRVRAPGMITCSAYAVRSTIGPVALVGTNEGEVVVYELLSGSFFKAIRTVERGVPVLSRKRLFVTSVVCHPTMMDAEATGNDVGYAGHNDGSIVSFKVMNGEMLKEFKAPAVETLDAGSKTAVGPGGISSGKGNEVASLACLQQPDGGRLVLCAAYENGNLFTFDANSGDPMSHFRAAPHIASIMPSSKYNMLLVTHDDMNAVLLWDLTTGNSLKFDFNHELAAVNKGRIKTTCATYDDHRGVLFSGANDGSIFVRKLELKDAPSLGTLPNMNMKLLRFCNPAPTAGAAAVLTSMWYDSGLDRLYTGDMTGVARVVKKVTGIAFEHTELGGGPLDGSAPTAPATKTLATRPTAGAGAGAGPAPSTTPGKWTLTWEGGVVEVQALGGMVTPKFAAGDGSTVAPLFVAPWTRDPDVSKLPPILRSLRGSYDAVPFGTARPVTGLTAEWEACKSDDSEGPHCGYGANSVWELVSQSSRALTIACKYPGHHPIQAVRKDIQVTGSTVSVKVTIEARSSVTVPLGSSIIFAVSARPQATRLVPGSFEYGAVFPGTVEPTSRPTFTLSPGASFTSLQSIPRRVPAGPGVSASGGDAPVDLSELPLADTQLEAQFQLFGSDGKFSIVREDLKQTFTVAWDPRLLPSALVHVSNCGRRYYPWNGAHASVTVSPTASAFDLGAVVSAADNPIRKRGYNTSIDLIAGTPFSYTFTISASSGNAPPSGVARTGGASDPVFALDDDL